MTKISQFVQISLRETLNSRPTPIWPCSSFSKASVGSLIETQGLSIRIPLAQGQRIFYYAFPHWGSTHAVRNLRVHFST